MSAYADIRDIDNLIKFITFCLKDIVGEKNPSKTSQYINVCKCSANGVKLSIYVETRLDFLKRIGLDSTLILVD